MKCKNSRAIISDCQRRCKGATLVNIRKDNIVPQKDPNKGNAVYDYRQISWKLQTGAVADDVYEYLDKNKLLLTL